jgi:hypothetical protein
VGKDVAEFEAMVLNEDVDRLYLRAAWFQKN